MRSVPGARSWESPCAALGTSGTRCAGGAERAFVEGRPGERAWRFLAASLVGVSGSWGQPPARRRSPAPPLEASVLLFSGKIARRGALGEKRGQLGPSG